jgi:hypothetical protein
MTYLIGVGGFQHIAVGSVEAFFADRQCAAGAWGNDLGLSRPSPSPQCRRRHGALHVDLARPLNERNPGLGGSRPASIIELQKIPADRELI